MIKFNILTFTQPFISNFNFVFLLHIRIQKIIMIVFLITIYFTSVFVCLDERDKKWVQTEMSGWMCSRCWATACNQLVTFLLTPFTCKVDLILTLSRWLSYWGRMVLKRLMLFGEVSGAKWDGRYAITFLFHRELISLFICFPLCVEMNLS